MHNMLTWDHRSRGEFRTETRQRLCKQYKTAKAVDQEIAKVAGCLPSPSFNCLFCCGYEERDAAHIGSPSVPKMRECGYGQYSKLGSPR